MTDRRLRARTPLTWSRRRYPRVRLDVDWFLEVGLLSTMGRSLDLSPRGARMPLMLTRSVEGMATVEVCLPGRARLFRARGQVASSRSSKSLIILFSEVSDEDLTLLGEVLVRVHGLGAVPALERRYGRFTALAPRVWGGST